MKLLLPLAILIVSLYLVWQFWPHQCGRDLVLASRVVLAGCPPEK